MGMFQKVSLNRLETICTQWQFYQLNNLCHAPAATMQGCVLCIHFMLLCWLLCMHVHRENYPWIRDRTGNFIVKGVPWSHRMPAVWVRSTPWWEPSSFEYYVISCVDHTYGHSSKQQWRKSCAWVRLQVFPPRTQNGKHTVRSRSNFDDDGARPVPYYQVVFPVVASRSIICFLFPIWNNPLLLFPLVHTNRTVQ